MSDIDRVSIGKLYGIWIHLSKDAEKIMDCFKEENGNIVLGIYNICRSIMYDNYSTKVRRGEIEGYSCMIVIFIGCQEMFNSRIPVCCFLSLLSPLSLISSCQEREEWQASPRTEIIEMGLLHRISFISLSTWWKGLSMTLFWYGLPFGLIASIAPCFLGNL